MAVLFFNSDVLLTAGEVQKRMADLQHWQAQITALQKQVAETQEWLNLVAKVIDPELANQLIGDVLLPTQVGTSDEAIPPSERHPRRSPMGEEVKRFLKTQTDGATSRQLIDHLLQAQEFREAVQRNRNRVYTVLSRLVESHEIRKIERSYFSAEAASTENDGSEEETAASLGSSEAHLSPPAGHDAQPGNIELGKDQDASGSGPQNSTIVVRVDPAVAPPGMPRTNSLNPAAAAEAPPKTRTPPIDFGGPRERELPPPTKSLFLSDPAAASSEAQTQPRSSPNNKAEH